MILPALTPPVAADTEFVGLIAMSSISWPQDLVLFLSWLRELDYTFLWLRELALFIVSVETPPVAARDSLAKSFSGHRSWFWGSVDKAFLTGPSVSLGFGSHDVIV